MAKWLIILVLILLVGATAGYFVLRPGVDTASFGGGG